MDCIRNSVVSCDEYGLALRINDISFATKAKEKYVSTLFQLELDENGTIRFSNVGKRSRLLTRKAARIEKYTVTREEFLRLHAPSDSESGVTDDMAVEAVEDEGAGSKSERFNVLPPREVALSCIRLLPVQSGRITKELCAVGSAVGFVALVKR